MPVNMEDDGWRATILNPLCLICKNLDRSKYRPDEWCTKGVSGYAPVRCCDTYTCEHFEHNASSLDNCFFDHIDGQFIPLSWDEIRRRRLEKEQREKEK